MLQSQQTTVVVAPLTNTYGVVQYERGLDIVEVEGWIAEQGVWLIVYGDRRRLPREQRHTMIPLRRVVEVDTLVADL